ncbi:hypothetical protein QUB60_05090 [Microcoleus sp. A2-C5]
MIKSDASTVLSLRGCQPIDLKAKCQGKIDIGKEATRRRKLREN